ncbi:MAG: helix-hairpin-helix domain-containing protein [Dysgonamonadaceae bacterium]|jgi:competence ComEA-like helix-hairpin-helix protein|nr:helix-hairpin-helix domain-containing protein [Dysgonamonadaceae bacterium]
MENKNLILHSQLKKAFTMTWKDFFYFSKRERRGILILIVFVAGVFFGKYLFTPQTPPPVDDLVLPAEQTTAGTEEKKTDASSVSSYPASPPSKPYRPYRKTEKPPEKRTYYQPPEQIPAPPKTNNSPKMEKLSPGTVVDINRSDTTELMKVPGIGSSFARRITGYRNLLGGFYRIEQLQEVYGMYEELYVKIIPYMTVNQDSIRTIAVHSASIDKLKSHPYINFYQAKAIIEMRKKNGKINDISELNLLEEFTPDDLERIRRYLDFKK